MVSNVKRFEDLLIWQKARQLTQEIYSLSNHWHDKSLQNQIRTASVFIVSNIAEGYERSTKEESIYFLYIARGSAGEVRAPLYIALVQKWFHKQRSIRFTT